jgi:hypothetical protein
VRGERSLMAFPFFALSKGKWTRPLSYDNGTVSIERRRHARRSATASSANARIAARPSSAKARIRRGGGAENLLADVRGERSLMAFPFFALSKGKWTRPLSYDNGTVALGGRHDLDRDGAVVVGQGPRPFALAERKEGKGHQHVWKRARR